MGSQSFVQCSAAAEKPSVVSLAVLRNNSSFTGKPEVLFKIAREASEGFLTAVERYLRLRIASVSILGSVRQCDGGVGMSVKGSVLLTLPCVTLRAGLLLPCPSGLSQHADPKVKELL